MEDDTYSQDNLLSGVEDSHFDSIDGFKKSLKKRFSSLVCGTNNDKSRSKPSEPSQPPSPEEDFKDNRTPYMTTEHQREKQQDDDVYDFQNEKRGLAIIINNVDFGEKKKKRYGSDMDASGLQTSFKRLGFDVLRYRNLEAWKIKEVLRGAATGYDHQTADGFVCAILSHGSDLKQQQQQHNTQKNRHVKYVRCDLISGIDGNTIRNNDIMDIFDDDSCPSLQGKPRMFFIQACRGIKLDDGIGIPVTKPRFTPGIKPKGRGKHDGLSQMDNASDSDDTPLLDTLNISPTDDTDAKPDLEEQEQSERDGATGNHPTNDIPIAPVPVYKDCLAMYATPPGYSAWRKHSGSPFITSLCEELDSGRMYRKSLLGGLTRVIGRVAHEYQSDTGVCESHAKKATPVIEHMLVKDIVFTRTSRRPN